MAAPVVSMVLNQLGTFLREEIHKEVIMVLGVKEEIEKLELTLTAIQAVLHDADKKQVQDQRVKVWLERLKEGRIEISGLRRVKSANEAKEVHLANKRGIHALALDFGFDFISFPDISEGDKERMVSVLEGLQPHPNLEELKINGFPGSKLPSWMILFSKLCTLELINLTRCTQLPSLGKLPFLEVLKISGMDSVRRLGLDFLGISDIEEEDNDATTSIGRGQLIAFPSLIKLELQLMLGLMEWVLPFERSDTLQIMPRLRILQIEWGPKLKVLPALGRLESLEELTISGMHSLKRIGPEFFGISEDVINRGSGGGQLIAFPSLIKLELLGMFELEEWVLPFESGCCHLELQIMPRLRKLQIYRAFKLKVLPALGRLESLEELTIHGLDSLKRIGPEFFGILEDEDVMKSTRCGSSRGGVSIPIIIFPKLKKLQFICMSAWEEWEMMMPSWREDVSFIMPCLKELILFECEKLKVVPHNIFSYQPVKERIEGCSELNQRSRRNQIIRRREVGESLNIPLFIIISVCSYNRRMDYSDDDDFTDQPTPLRDEIRELIHLRYLDLSRTSVMKLPNSLSNLRNLQILKLNGCENLCELLASMGNMIRLRHLEIYSMENLRSLPEGIERLPSLPSLTKKVKLASKRGIHAITLDFGLPKESENISEGYKERMEGVLEGLQPHPNLEELKINQYPGSKLPSWMMSDLALMLHFEVDGQVKMDNLDLMQPKAKQNSHRWHESM
ncbi:hypothetical protein GIB67_027909 [Kingdonia uniflora]|uniref:R13L1/DRL21-like LRR repeat region domain-containing protein n=1 Tax=Kingdonia uniflora TaxID=39325 RepID=A0A7J7LGD4_9MAGN|nr:hypothetical protein GIB67_027909 [Kingdonia uniflora]